MAIVNVVEGDMIARAKMGNYGAILHGANCFHAMGSGLAPKMKEAFPECFVADKATKRGDIDKLGTYSYCKALAYNGKIYDVLNCYTQFKTGANVDYDAIKTVFEKINADYIDKNTLIGIPLIGCGIAGGDWNKVSKIIDKATPNVKLELVKFKA